MAEIRVALVAGDLLGCGGIKAILATDPGIRVVGETVVPMNVPDLMRKARPDIILVDTAGFAMEINDILSQGASDGSGRPVSWVLLLRDGDKVDLGVARHVSAAVPRADTDAAQLREIIRLVAAGYVFFEQDLARMMIASASDNEANGSPALTVLTTREREVFRLLVQGRSNADIAMNLYIAKSTVKSHVENILKKLHLRNRLDLVIYSYASTSEEPP